MFQNKVDPFGNIFKTKARGSIMGNRGVIHDVHKNIARPYKLKAWLTCLLEFKDRHLEVMAPNRYTHLFFLDEATAFAAGHRPCSECRKDKFNQFKLCWIMGNPEYGFDRKVHIAEIDQVLHSERIDGKGRKLTHEEASGDLPGGCFILLNDTPFLFADQLLFKWSPFGYAQGIAVPDVEKFTVLTPLSVVNAFRAGYVPEHVAGR